MWGFSLRWITCVLSPMTGGWPSVDSLEEREDQIRVNCQHYVVRQLLRWLERARGATN